MSKKPKPWEQQDGESVKAFEAFDTYLKMGYTRSVRRVAQELGKSSTIIERWSKRWKWQKRIQQYNNEIKGAEAAEEKSKAVEARKRQLAMAIAMQKKAFESLKKLDPEDLAPKDAIKLLTEGIRIENEIYGMNEQAGTDVKDNFIEAISATAEEDWSDYDASV